MMLKSITKAVIAVSIIGASAYAISKIVEKNEAAKTEGSVEPPVVEDSIKEAAKKKVAKILAFVATHAEEVEAVSMVIGLGSSVFGIMSSFRDFRKGNDTQDKLDEINRKLDILGETYNNNVNVYNNNMDKLFDGLKGITENQSLIYDTVAAKSVA